jgi:hypothetical protein
MSEEIITEEMTVAEALDCAPGALRLFQKYGVNPITDCGLNRYTLRLYETPARCKVERVEALIADLNAAMTVEA